MKQSRPVVKYAITFAVGLVLAFIVMLIRNIFSMTDGKEIIKTLCDAFFVPGVLLACFGALVMLSNGGAFDMIAYGVRQFFALFRTDLSKRRYKDYYEYKTEKRGENRSFFYLVAVGAAFIVISLIILIFYYR